MRESEGEQKEVRADREGHEADRSSTSRHTVGRLFAKPTGSPRAVPVPYHTPPRGPVSRVLAGAHEGLGGGDSRRDRSTGGGSALRGVEPSRGGGVRLVGVVCGPQQRMV